MADLFFVRGDFDMGIIDNGKAVVKLIQEIDNVDLYKKILDLQSEIMNLVDENRELKSKILSLEKTLNTKESLKFAHNAYWLSGDKIDGPFCTKCWDKERQTVRMLTTINPQYHECPSCKSPVNTSGRDEDPVDDKVISDFDPRAY